jgi:uncharacterized protein with GYD domain
LQRLHDNEAQKPLSREAIMPKYLIQASYAGVEGYKGLQKDKASGRKAAVSAAAESLGGRLESMYFAFGEHDVFTVLDLPDNVSASALSLAVLASGLVHAKTTPLLTIEETDQALQKNLTYRAPGR